MPQRIPILGAPAPERQPRATPEVFGDPRGQAALGRGLEIVGETTARVFDNYHRTRAQRGAVQAGINLRKAAMEAAEENDPVKAGALFDQARAVARENAKSALGDLPSGYSDLFEDLVDEDEATVAFEVASKIRRQGVENAGAEADWSLAQLADREAQALTPESAAATRQQAEDIIGTAQHWDTADKVKRINTYRDTVAEAALSAGLADDPAAIRAQLTARAGPFAEMPQKWIEAAELKAQRRVETLERASRAELRRAEADESRERTERKRAAQSALATKGRPDGPGVTVEDVLEHVDDLAGEADYWFSVAGRGGFIVDPEAMTPTKRAAATAESARLEGLTPAQLAEEPLNAALLGPELDNWRSKQETLRQRRSDIPRGYLVRANARLKQMQLDPWGFDDAVLNNGLEDSTLFWQEAELAVLDWADREKKDPNPTQQEEILDQLVLDMAAKRGTDITPGPHLGINPRNRAHAVRTESARPLPTDERELVSGQLYETPQGVFLFDGEGFVPPSTEK
jgi:hypothetical protein